MRKTFLTFIFSLLIAGSALAVGRANVTNVTLTSATTEYSWTIPAGCTAFTIQSRTAADFKLATTSGASGTTYFTVKAGMSYYESDIKEFSWGNKFYFQSANAGQVIEIVYWINN